MAEKTPQDYARELMEMYRATNSIQNDNIKNQSGADQTQTESQNPQIVVPPSMVFDDGVGGLTVNVTTLRRLYPVKGALVTVFTGEPDSMQIIEIDTTDESGQTGMFRLKTPAKSESQQVNNNGEIPYANYNVSVRSDGYVEQIAMNVPVFSGVVSVQGVDLTPISAAGKHTSPQIIQGGSNYNL